MRFGTDEDEYRCGCHVTAAYRVAAQNETAGVCVRCRAAPLSSIDRVVARERFDDPPALFRSSTGSDVWQHRLRSVSTVEPVSVTTDPRDDRVEGFDDRYRRIRRNRPRRRHGGLPVALKSAYSGLNVALVEDDPLGGTASDVANAIHVRPTLSEVVNAAAGEVHRPS